MGKIYVGQTGVKVELETGSDLSAATITEIKYLLPDGTDGTWTADTDGTKLYYVTESSDELPISGEILVQAHASGEDFDLLGETARLLVSEKWK